MRRRDFVEATALTMMAGWASSCARRTATALSVPATPQPRTSVNLALPRISWERVIRTTVGLRPHRDSGFVLKTEKFDAKTVIHDYGFGGAGMSLAWGCGAMAANMALQHDERRAAVLGCGSPGLTAARQLQRRGLPDSAKILTSFGRPGETRYLRLFDLPSGEWNVLVEHPKDLLAGARLSSDGQWASFVETTAPTRRRIFVVPATGKTALPQNQWIPITDGQRLDREPRWSPDGKLLYFLSERDGFRCFWAQPLDPATKHPAGAPFAVQHFHRARFSIRYPDTGTVGLGIARDKIVFAMGETTGNIWMVQ